MACARVSPRPGTAAPAGVLGHSRRTEPVYGAQRGRKAELLEREIGRLSVIRNGLMRACADYAQREDKPESERQRDFEERERLHRENDVALREENAREMAAWAERCIRLAAQHGPWFATQAPHGIRPL